MNQIIGKLIPKRPVHIWGAGVSGLVLGFYLKKMDYEVTIYEKSDRAGGKIGTNQTEFGPIEIGANALYLSFDALDLLDELKLTPIPAAPKLKRFLYIHNKFKSPLSLSLILKIFFGWKKTTPAIPNLTVEEFFRPLIGKKLINNLLSPALGGIYASEAHELDFESLFPEEFTSLTYGEFIKRMKARAKKNSHTRLKGSVSFKGGMQVLIDGLVNDLKDHIKLNYQGEFKLQDNTVICTDAKTAAELLAPTHIKWSEQLERIQYKPLSTTTVFVKNKIPNFESSFGVLIPRKQNLSSIGVLANSEIFPENYAQYPSYTFITPEINNVRNKMVSDLQILAPGIHEADILFAQTKSWSPALPVYNLRRKQAVNGLHEMAQTNPGVILFGNYVAGISLREMITAAKNFSLS